MGESLVPGTKKRQFGSKFLRGMMPARWKKVYMARWRRIYVAMYWTLPRCQQAIRHARQGR